MATNDIFKAEAKTFQEVMHKSGNGFYIPAYQRPYSWGSDEINRLFEDVQEALFHLAENNEEDACCFLGTLILIWDKENKTVKPAIKEELPSQVSSVVDGQQRLTTLILSSILFRDRIAKLLEKSKKKSPEGFSQLHNFAEKSIVNLKNIYTLDYGFGDYQYYPRMVRALQDTWSKQKNTKEYTSPISSTIEEAIKYANGDISNPEYPPISNGGEEYLKIKDAVKSINKCIDSYISKGKVDDDDLSSWEDGDLEYFTKSDILQTLLFDGAKLEDEIKIALLSQDIEKDTLNLFKVLIFAEFLLKRVILTRVETHNEKYAFSAFEALNTTGQPLTAWETFKPAVIEYVSDAIGLEEYESSEEYEQIQIIDQNLEAANSKTKEAHTKDTIISHLLIQGGQKCGKHLSEQRSKLRKFYSALDMQDDKFKFIFNLAVTSKAYKNLWRLKKDDSLSNNLKADIPNITEDAIFAFYILKDVNNSLALAPILRFLQKENIATDANEMSEVIKATAAFFILWRSMRADTGGIDKRYRDLMSDGVEGVIPALKYFNDQYKFSNNEEKITAEALKSAYRKILSNHDNGIDSKDDWVKKVARVPLYQKQKTMAKAIILAANHKAKASGTSGMLEPRPTLDDNSNMLLSRKWESYNSIEHIAPQNPGYDDWDKTIYNGKNGDDDIIHRLGNLTLLPIENNTTVKNYAWDVKRKWYGLFCADSYVEQKQIFDELKLSDDVIKKYENSEKYIELAKSLHSFDGAWDEDFIMKRGENTAEMAWNVFSSWLDY